MKIIPTILATNKKDFNRRFKTLTKITKEIQIDFMDGKFVKNKSISLKDTPSLRKKETKFEAHLMVEKPNKWLPEIKQKGFNKVLFHYSAFKTDEEVFETIKKSKKLGLKTFLAINPGIKIDKIEKFFKRLDGILVMGVNPGKENQKLLPSTTEKISKIKEKTKRLTIQVDGGVNDKNISKLSQAGAKIINSGSFISEAEDPLEALKTLRKKAKQES